MYCIFQTGKLQYMLAEGLFVVLTNNAKVQLRDPYISVPACV